MMMGRITETKWLHPSVRKQFEGLEQEVAGEFRLLETFRTPWRQESLRSSGAFAADPWESAHQYGLAADFVGLMRNGVITWSPHHPWPVLAEQAVRFGLCVPDPVNDAGHVELVNWRRLILL